MEQRQVDSRWRRAAILLVKYALAWIPFIQVGLCLAAQPAGDAHAMLMFFVPPVVASLFLLADNGRIDRTVIRGAWILLAVNSVASAFAEVDILPLKPQFPGILPPHVDRVFVYYLVGWYSFVAIVCPGWYLHWRIFGDGRSTHTITWQFRLFWLYWAFIVIVIATLIARKLF